MTETSASSQINVFSMGLIQSDILLKKLWTYKRQKTHHIWTVLYWHHPWGVTTSVYKGAVHILLDFLFIFLLTESHQTWIKSWTVFSKGSPIGTKFSLFGSIHTILIKIYFVHTGGNISCAQICKTPQYQIQYMQWNAHSSACYFS